jgi:hypothetical protein
MNPFDRSLLLCALAVFATAPALAFNPGTGSRAAATASTGGSTTVCENGTNDGTICTISGDCTGGGSCTSVADVEIVARGVLTIVTDTQPVNNGWADTSYPGVCSEPSAGNTSDCEHKDNSLLTLVLEFTLNGERYLFAESFKQLPDGGTCGFPPCDFVVPNWPIGGGDSQAGWSQQVVESILAETAAEFGNDTVKIRWGGLPPAVENAVGAVVGKSPTQRIALSRTDEVPVCTDATPCNHGPRNDRFSDHSSGTDVLATVRRYKVDVAIIGP